MAFTVITAVTIFAILQCVSAGTVGISSGLTVTTPGRLDPFNTGKWGNPGARAFVCGKSLEAIHDYVSDLMARALEALSVLDYSINLGSGTLTVKPPRVTEASYGRAEYKMAPPNRVQSRFFDGRLRARGVWQFKPLIGDMIGGMYQATIDGMELNTTNQLGRTSDCKPMVQVVDCRANVSQYRIEIQGSSDIQSLDDCKLDACMKIRKFFEDAICNVYGRFVKEIINRELQAYPTRVNIYGDQQKVDYCLMNNEPTVTDKCISVGMEGKYIWRSGSAVPFYPSEMQWLDRNRMVSFQLSDFTFNTLMHQVHVQGHKFSAADLVEQSPAMQQLLALNCSDEKAVMAPGPNPTTSTSTTKTTTKTTTTKATVPPKSRKYARGPPAPAAKPAVKGYNQGESAACLGQVLETFKIGKSDWAFAKSDIGEIIYKSGPKAGFVFVQSDKGGVFDGSNGVLEIYGPVGHGGYRQLLVRTEVRLLRAEFMPKMNGANITATVKIIDLELVQPPPQSRMSAEWLMKLAQFVTPILNDMINDFMMNYAQFPVSLPEKYECTSPEFSIMPRTMQIDCDARLRSGKGYGKGCDHCSLV